MDLSVYCANDDNLVVQFMFASEGFYEQPLVADEGVARVLPGGGLVLLNEEVRIPRQSISLQTGGIIHLLLVLRSSDHLKETETQQ